jgi:3',5'-cyclic AMP phosphodiesterase CpdA
MKLAHLSDVHLGPVPAAAIWTDYLNKRAIGYMSWRFRRRKIHDRDVLDAVIADIHRHKPDHVALTGDLVNIALPAEFTQASEWLKSFGLPDWITFVPGNHDAYVETSWETGAGLLADYMTGDMRMPGHRRPDGFALPFPFVRQRRNVALIGVSTAVPQSLRRAGGMLGAPQIEALGVILRDLGEKGFCRILLIHHAPLPGQSIARKALSDAAGLRDIIKSNGVELVLYGHKHAQLHNTLETRSGLAHVMGVPSASAGYHEKHPPAGWNLFSIRRQDGVWRIDFQSRVWDYLARAMKDGPGFSLV